MQIALGEQDAADDKLLHRARDRGVLAGDRPSRIAVLQCEKILGIEFHSGDVTGMHHAERLAPEFFRDGGALRFCADRSRRFGRSEYVALEFFRHVDRHDGLLLAGVAVMAMRISVSAANAVVAPRTAMNSRRLIRSPRRRGRALSLEW